MALLELGATLTLAPRDAFLLERKIGLHEIRLRVRGNPDLQEFHGLLHQIHQLAVHYAEAEVERAGSAGRKLAEVAAQSSLMTCAAVVDLLGGGITERGVRDAATSGRLLGTKDAKGRWLFERDDVIAFGAARNRSAA